MLSINLSAQTLIWAEEFNYSGSPDPSKWGNELGYIRNNELQYYTNRSQNQIVRNGSLEITAIAESYSGYNYTSSSLNSKNKISFQYGKIEARMKLPQGQGIWPAFWTLGTNIDEVGWPRCGEIDIMEHINNNDFVTGTVHWLDGSNNHTQNQGYYNNIDVTQWHVYSVIWDETSTKWFVDENLYHEIDITNGINGTEELHNSQYILLNLAIGGDWPGAPDTSTAFPATMFVDYVRVYEFNPAPVGDIIEAEDYIEMSGIRLAYSNDVGGGEYVGWIDAGDWAKYNVGIPNAGRYNMNFRVSANNSGGKIIIDKDSNSTYIGEVSISGTGGDQNWKTVTAQVDLPAGNYPIGLYFEQGLFNLNWFSIESVKLLSEKENANEVNIYPSPVSDYIELRFQNKQNNQVSVSDINGREVLSKKYLNVQSVHLDIETLTSGIYFVKVSGVDYYYIIKKIFKK